MTIYTWGYGGHSLEDLQQLRARLGAVVIDTRYSPRSRRPEFNRRRLEAALGADYVWMPEFGNLNYKGALTDAVVLNDPTAGLQRLRTVAAGRPPLLICQCPTRSCHRTDVADFIAAATGWTIDHLS